MPSITKKAVTLPKLKKDRTEVDGGRLILFSN